MAGRLGKDHPDLMAAREQADQLKADLDAALRSLAAREDATESALMVPENFRGPEALVVGQLSTAAMELAGALISRYSRADPATGQIRVTVPPGQQVPAGQQMISASSGRMAESVETL